MAWSWKGFCSVCAFAGATCLCVVTGGAAIPLVAASAAPFVIGGATAVGFFIGDTADKESIEREKNLMQNEKYRDVKNEVDKQLDNNNQVQNKLNEIAGKLNGTIPKAPNETKESLENEFIVLSNQLKNGQSRLDGLRNSYTFSFQTK